VRYNKLMYKRSRAFTLVELIVVISIIGILATIGSVSYYRVQRISSDSQRSAKITAIIESLEKYYSDNGEYPSCSDMTKSSSTVVSRTLKWLDPNSLATPGATTGTNSVTCLSPTSTSDSFGYIDGGSQYYIKYYSLASEAVVTFKSRHNPNVIDKPSIPAVTVVLNNPNVIATIAPVICTRGIPQYGIRSRTDGGAFDAYTSWSGVTTATQPANLGVMYIYQAQARCFVPDFLSSLTTAGVESTFTNPIPSPAAPTVTANTVTTITTWSWPAVTCTAGTTNYQYRYTISPSGYDSGWVSNGGVLSVAFTTSTKGQLYTVNVQSRCVGTFTSSAWSVSGSANYLRPLTWLKISASYNHTCAIASNNLAYCWGQNTYGELGNNSTVDSLVPAAVYMGGILSGKTITAISAGDLHTCAIASDNQAYCWGANWNGQLGNNTTINSSIPVAVNISGVLSGKTIKSISGGFRHNCVIASNDLAYCWGNNGGELGDGTTTTSSIPVAVVTSGALSGKTIKSITAANYGNTCAIASDNQAYCWGTNDYGQLIGVTRWYNSSVPVMISNSGALSGKTILSITIGYSYICAIASDNQAYCWGYDGGGGLGNNNVSVTLVASAINNTGALSGKTLSGIISAGSNTTCVIASDSKEYCWGSAGTLGVDTPSGSKVPIAVDTSGVLIGKTAIAIAPGRSHSCSIASDSYIYCWGNNSYGQLGNNSTVFSYVPVALYLGLYY